MKKRFVILTIVTVLLLISLTSCGSLFSGKGNVPSNSGTKVTLSGTLSTEGALPHEIFETGDTARTAFPLIDATKLTFEVTATNTRNSAVTKGTVSDDHTSFTIPELDTQEEYTILISAKKGDVVILTGSQTLTITTANCSSLKIDLTPDTEGTGSIDLAISTGDAEISKIIWTLDGSTPSTLAVSTSAKLSISDVPAGSHRLNLKFIKTITDGARSADLIVYQCDEAVNVLSGLITDTWLRSGTMTDMHLVPAGKPADMSVMDYFQYLMEQGATGLPGGKATFELCSDLTEYYEERQLFVSINGNDTTGTGSYFKPYRTLTKAIEKANTIPTGQFFITITVEPGLSEKLEKDLAIPDTDFTLEIYDFSFDQTDQEKGPEYTIDTNGHNIIISGESSIHIHQAAIKNTSETNSYIKLTTENQGEEGAWGSSVTFRGCELNNLSIDSYGSVTLGNDYNDENYATNTLTDVTFNLKGNSVIYIEEEHEEGSLLIDVSEHDADTWTYLPIGPEAGAYCTFIYNEYQTDVNTSDEGISSFQEYDHNWIYVNPDVYDSKETGTVRNPYKTFAKAIENARDSDTIALPRGLTISDESESASVTIDKDLTIDAYGEGDARAIIDSTQLNLLLADGDKVYINNIEFNNKANKTYDSGSFIAAKYHLDESFTPFNGTVSCTNCTFTGGKASQYAGAIHIAEGCTLTLDTCKFEGNTADSGGAIRNYGTIIANDCEFTSNKSTGDRDTTTYLPKAGTIDNYGSCTLTDSTFESNSSQFGSGGIFNDMNCTLTITGGSFKLNESEKFVGGAIISYGSCTLTDIIFSQNSSPEGEGGGAIVAIAGTIKKCTFEENAAQMGGALLIMSTGSFTAEECKFTSNEAGGGGAVFANGTGEITFKKCEFTSNTAQLGGALALQEASINLEDCQFIKNKTTEQYGGAIATAQASMVASGCSFTENVGYTSGGAVYAQSLDDYVTSFKNCTFKGNKTNTNNEGLYLLGNGIISGNIKFYDEETLKIRRREEQTGVSGVDTVLTIAGDTNVTNDSGSSVKIPLYWDPDVSDDFEGINIFADDYSKSKAAELFTVDASMGSYVISNGTICKSGISGSVSVATLYSDITINYSTTGGSITFTGLDDVDDTIQYEIWYHGSDVNTGSLTNSNGTCTLDMNSYEWPGLYQIVLGFTQGGSLYSASFDFVKE